MYHSEFGRRLRTQSGGSSSLAPPSGGSPAPRPVASPGPTNLSLGGSSLASSSRSPRPNSISGVSARSDAAVPFDPDLSQSLGPSHSAASLAARRRRRSSQMSAGGLRHAASSESLHSSPNRSMTRSPGVGAIPASPSRSSALSASIGSAQSSASSRRRTVFVDRFIPSRHGDDLHDAYQLLDNYPTSPGKGKKASPVDTDAQKG